MSDSRFKGLEFVAGVDATLYPPSLVPANVDELSALMQKASRDSIPLFVSGAGTSIPPRSSDGVIIVSTSRILPPTEIDAGDFVIVAGAGTRVETLAAEAEKQGFAIPADIVYGRRATIGGAFMSGRYGASSYLSRALNDSVIGVRAVTADGKIITGGGRTAKNVTGYELTRFLAGTMGLYAIVFELTIKANPLPQSRIVVDAHIPWETINGSGDGVATLNTAFPDAVLYEIIRDENGYAVLSIGFEGLECITSRKANAAAEIMSTIGATSVRQVSFGEFVSMRRGEAGRIAALSNITVTLPPAAVMTFIERAVKVTGEPPSLVHPLAGKVHFPAFRDEAAFGRVSDISRSLGGKVPVSLEALRRLGVSGLFSGPELEIVRKLKHELDPKSILNPHLLNGFDS